VHLTGTPSISPAQDGWNAPHSRKHLGDKNHQRRFSGSSHGQVSNADYRTMKPSLAKNIGGIRPITQSHHGFVSQSRDKCYWRKRWRQFVHSNTDYHPCQNGVRLNLHFLEKRLILAFLYGIEFGSK
jgi:hypothetical protein